jgi:DNA-binding NarL/FixJ family response regulator
MCNSPARVKPRLLIVDSNRLRQAGIARLLESWADAMGLAVSTLVPDATLDACCASAFCEMTIINAGSSSIQSLETQALIANVRRHMPQALLVIISDRDDPQEIYAAFKQGAVGFLLTSIEPAVAFQALSFIRNGGSFFPPSVLSTCFTQVAINGAVQTSDFTVKQKEVFERLCQGHSNKAIARQLDISEATVKVHVRRIMHKFGVANRTQLAIAAMNHSSLPLADDKLRIEDVNRNTNQPASSPGRAATKVLAATPSARVQVMDFLTAADAKRECSSS